MIMSPPSWSEGKRSATEPNGSEGTTSRRDMARERIDDRPFRGLIRTWLKAGVLDTDGQVLHPVTGLPQGGISTLPTKLQTFFFGIRIASVRIDPKHDIDLIPGYFHPLHQGPDKIPLARPVGCLQSAVDFGRKIFESANNQL